MVTVKARILELFNEFGETAAATKIRSALKNRFNIDVRPQYVHTIRYEMKKKRPIVQAPVVQTSFKSPQLWAKLQETLSVKPTSFEEIIQKIPGANRNVRVAAKELLDEKVAEGFLFREGGDLYALAELKEANQPANLQLLLETHADSVVQVERLLNEVGEETLLTCVDAVKRLHGIGITNIAKMIGR